MSTKAKIIIALVVVAIIVGVTIWLYNKKKKEKTAAGTDPSKKAIKTPGPAITPRTPAPAAAAQPSFDFTE